MMPFRAYSAFDRHAVALADQPMVETESGSLSYREAAREVNRLLNGFAALGIGPDDRVALVAKNRAEVLLMLLAALKGGPVVVPVNHRLAPEEMAWIIDDAECVAMFAEPEFVERLASADLPRIPQARRFVVGGSADGWRRFDDWLVEQSAVAPPASPDLKPAYLQIYTSGTTGRPKGVQLGEANCLAHQMAIMSSTDVELAAGQRMYGGLPLFHVGGVFAALWAVQRGTTLLFRRDFNPVEVNQLLGSGELDHAAMVPAMIQACVAQPADPGHSYERLRTMMYGASPIAPALLRKAAERFGCGFLQVYGMTETHSVISTLCVQDHAAALAARPELTMSAGRPVAGCHVRIVDENGRERGVGEVGEICVRGPQVMSGYWKRQDATDEAIRDGYMHTGDAGYIDADGYLFIVDRIKDIIVSGGENVSSSEVEHALLAHPNVADAAVIGVPDPRWGEAVKAIVVPRGELDPDALIAHCRGSLGGFKVPRSVDVVDAIPRNGAGKILKAVLREPYWQQQRRRVG
ncbi:MAG: long-chain-fatty-acid--CoA ligase [Nevskiales bacterium]|nr:long-chain-fatty-acid--CoA ligase [Nevskiales bacterium]